jgi:uncharacterized membrane protein
MDETWLENYLNDLLAIGVTVFIIAMYHVYLRRLARRNPASVLSSVATRARTAWVESIMAENDNGILAIQTLRNTTLAATFLASTAILLMLGVLTLSGQGPGLNESWHYLNIAGSLRPALWPVKLLSLLLFLFFAFFCFSNAIRTLNHVGYMITIESVPEQPRFSPTQVAGELNRGGRYFSLGVRTFYYLVPVVFWLFGPLYMVGATCMLVGIFLPRIDVRSVAGQSE